jgi:hypothetical protein
LCLCHFDLLLLQSEQLLFAHVSVAANAVDVIRLAFGLVAQLQGSHPMIIIHLLVLAVTLLVSILQLGGDRYFSQQLPLLVLQRSHQRLVVLLAAPQLVQIYLSGLLLFFDSVVQISHVRRSRLELLHVSLMLEQERLLLNEQFCLHALELQLPLLDLEVLLEIRLRHVDADDLAAVESLGRVRTLLQKEVFLELVAAGDSRQVDVG